MKSKTKRYASILIGCSAMMINSSAMAEEEVIKPQIVFCDFHPGIEIAEDENTDEDVEIEIIDDEVIDEEISNEDGEEVLDDSEVTIDDGEVIICWDPDWVRRDNDDDTPVYLYSTTGGPVAESTGGETESSAPQAADEQSAVTKVEKNTVSANISRVANKPTAVITKGRRVFLR